MHYRDELALPLFSYNESVPPRSNIFPQYFLRIKMARNATEYIVPYYLQELIVVSTLVPLRGSTTLWYCTLSLIRN